MANNNNNKEPKRKVFSINLNFSWFYILLIGGIIWMLWDKSDVPPQKVEWAEVQEMVMKGDVKSINFVRNDYKEAVTLRLESVEKYTYKFPDKKVPGKSPHFIFLVSTSF